MWHFLKMNYEHCRVKTTAKVRHDQWLYKAGIDRKVLQSIDRNILVLFQ